MKRFSRALSVLLAVLLAFPYIQVPAASAAGEEVIAKWSFSSQPTLPVGPTEGTLQESGEFSVHKKTPTDLNHTPGNRSIYTGDWAVGDYWQARFSTSGYSQIVLKWQQWGSNTGPRDFKLQYSLDGVNFTDEFGYALTATASTGYQRNLPSALDDQPLVYIRWVVDSDTAINGSTIASTGNSRIAEIEILGIPKPSDPGQTARPDASKITLTDDEWLTGEPGAVTGEAYVYVYREDPATVSSAVYDWYATANSDGSFGPIRLSLGGGSDVWVTAQEAGKAESLAVKISIQTTAAPDASKIIFADNNITGYAGAVPGGSTVKAYFDDDSEGGTATAEPDGSFELALTNPDGKTEVYLTAKEPGKRESAKVLIRQREQYKPGDIVISQFYPNGGNSGAFYKTKFVELYNTTDKDIEFNGEWFLLYGSATGTALGTNSNTRVQLTGTIPARGYYLVTGNSGSNGADLPVTADQTSTLNPSGGNPGGILALVYGKDPSNPAVSSQDDPALIDVVAYGNGSNTDFAFKTDKWGSPFYVSNVQFGTILRKTDTGSDPRGVVGAGNGWFTRNPSEDFVMNIPMATSDPKEIVVRNSKYRATPDASRITFTETGGTAVVTGAAGAVPADAVVNVYVSDNQGVVPNLTLAGTANADANGAFTVSFSNSDNAPSVFVTHAASPTAPESAYARIDRTPDPNAVRQIGDLRAVNENGVPLHIGYRTVIEGVATTANQALGDEPTSFHLQDGTGGIHVVAGKSPSALGASVSVETGRKFKVTGYPILAAGTLQFVAEAIDYTGDETPPAPAAMALADLADLAKAEAQEGKLVAVSGKLTNIPALGPDYDLTLADDDGHSVIVRILGKTGIDVQKLSVGESFRFIGLLAQSKLYAPYHDRYLVYPRSDDDVKGELQLSHQPLEKAYIGFDVHLRAQAKYADEVVIYYRAESDTDYESVRMTTADGQNYTGTIPKEYVPQDKFYYYIEATTVDGQKKSVGSAAQPFEVPVVQDTDGPAFFNEQPRDGSEVETPRPVISVEMEDPNGVKTDSVRITVDGRDYTAKAVISETLVKLEFSPDDVLDTGEHTVTVTAEDGIGNRSTFTWKFRVAARFTGGNHYYGSTHNHTNISHDAAGDPEDALIAAMLHGYDWFAFSDHSHDIDPDIRGTDVVDRNGLPERTGGAEWQLTKRLSDQYTKDGEFVVFPSFEMTSTTWGHSNVFGTDNFVDRVQNGGLYQDLSKYYAWILTYDDIAAQFNHPTWGGAKPFNGFLPYDRKLDDLFTMIEVGNGSGQYTYVNAEDIFFQALDLGWHLAPTFGEDNHNATWGQTKKRTVIVAKELTRDALLDSMRKLRVYMTEDPNFRLDVLASGWYMGSTTDTKTLKFEIRGEDPVWEEKSDPKYSYLDKATNDHIDRVDLITNGGVIIDTFRPSGNVTSFTWNPEFTVIGGQQWFVVRVTQKDGDRIYSSPIWSPVEPLSIRVTHVEVEEGGMVGGVPATLVAGLSNTGLLDVADIRVDFYYDQIDGHHRIGSVDIPSLKVNESMNVSVIWNHPEPGERKIIVTLASESADLGGYRFEQLFEVKRPLGKTILIDASKNNENTTKDTGSYNDNLKRFTTQMRQAGFTVEENEQPITAALLEKADILFISQPASAYSESEREAIAKFVANGGGLFMAGKGVYNNTAGADRLNDVLAEIGSAIRINKDELYDETEEGNFWSNPLNQRWAVRLHPLPAMDHTLNDFVSTIEFYSGASLAADDDSGGLAPLAESETVRVLVRGNETTFQNSGSIAASAARYNVHTPSSGSSGPARDDITGGSAIPVVAAETIGPGRLVVAGMNIFNDLQMDESYNEKGNNEFAHNVMHWLVGLEPKVMPIREARMLPTGTETVVQGRVTSAAGVFFDAFFLQDDTGGIMAFNEVPDDALDLGDVVRVYGKIEIFENSLEIQFGSFDRSVVRITSGPPVDPTPLSTKESVAEEHQGKLVKVTGVMVERPDELMFLLDDGSGPVLIFVDGYIVNQSGPMPPMKVGDTVEAVGMADRYSGGDRIRVRNVQELKVVAKGIYVTGVEVSPTELTLTVGQTAKLTANVKPDNATVKTVRWSSSDERIATVQDGMVTAVSPGRAAITVETVDGGHQATARVTVLPRSTGSGGSGSGGSGGVENIASPVAPGDGKDAILDVAPGSVREGEDGNLYLDVPEGTQAIRIPADFAEQLTQGSLVLQAGSVRLDVPADALRELADLPVSGEERADSILVTFTPLSEEDADLLLQAVEQNSGLEIQVFSGVYDVALGITGGDGTGMLLSEFAVPLVIHLPAGPDANPELAAIFRIAEDGSYEYVGGQYDDGTIRVEVTQPGKYVVLEMTRPFADLDPGHWAYTTVQKLVAMQLVRGTSDTTFEPNRPITRQEFALLLVLALNPDGLGGELAELPFEDVDRIADWAKQAIAWAVRENIILGDGAGRIRPDAPITRAEMAVMVARALGLGGGSLMGSPGFADSEQIPDWAIDAAEALRQLGLVQGRGNGQFAPREWLSRAEAAKIILNLLQYLKRF